MAEMKKFTIEGDAVFGYSTDDGLCVKIDGDCLPELIGRQLGFPNDDEWEAMYKRLEGLRDQGLMPAEGEPDISREGTRLKITVEVVD